jgi:hypothetical protein
VAGLCFSVLSSITWTVLTTVGCIVLIEVGAARSDYSSEAVPRCGANAPCPLTEVYIE